jgi:uncharacterized BrkB/YihY/UPF0761 family membrane protein
VDFKRILSFSLVTLGLFYSSIFAMGLSCTVYQQQQIPPQQGSLEEGAYQQQSYKPGAVFFVFLFFAFLVLFFIVNTSHLTQN